MQRFFFIFTIFFAVTIIFGLIFGLWWGIYSKNQKVNDITHPPSPMVGKQAVIHPLHPIKFSLNPLKGYGALPESLPKEPFIINFFASWCQPCAIEHPYLAELYEQKIPIYGINWKDGENGAIAFLKKHGNVYHGTGFDPEGHLGISYGIKGLPETFVVDNQGTIVYHLRGPIDKNEMKRIKTFFRE